MLGRWIFAAIMALIVPVVAYLGLTGLNHGVESGWRDALIAEYGEIPADAADELRLEALCADPKFAVDLEEVCRDTNLLGLLRALAVVSGITALVVLGVAGGTAILTRGRPRMMAATFRPALRIVLGGTAVLLILEAIVFVGLVWEAMTVWVGRIWPWFILAFVVAAFGAVAAVLGSIANMASSPPVKVAGVALRREDHPDLFAEVESVAAGLGTDPPTHLLAGLEPNFFVVDAPVEALDGSYTGRTMFVSSAVTSVLSRGELRAIIGHELGHFRGADTEFTRQVSPLYAAARDSMGSLVALRGGISGFITLPASYLLGGVFDTLVASVSEVSRARELEADLAGAQSASAAELGSALVKLRRTTAAWDRTLAAAMSMVAAGRPMPDLGAGFAGHAREVATSSDSVRERIPHPFDTHPPIPERLEHLGLDASGVDSADLDLEPNDPATALFGDLAALNRGLSDRLAPTVEAVAQTQRVVIVPGPSHALRVAAQDDPGIAASVLLAVGGRDASLGWPESRDGTWAVLADLHLDGLPVASRHHISWAVRPSDLPSGGIEVVADVALAGDPEDARLPRGTRLRLVGRSAPDRQAAGHNELVLAGMLGSAFAERLVVICGVCDAAPVRAQAAGLLVAPWDDILNAASGPIAEEVLGVARAMAATRGRAEPGETD